jgi:NAD(P)H-hydrate repair Nnr-like enzyme with NAD(P)H-hydrate dehydratase domain
LVLNLCGIADLQAANMQRVPIVIDADGLSIVMDYPDTVKGYNRAVLTPNTPEFWRLASALDVQHGKKPALDDRDALQVCPAIRTYRSLAKY